MNEKTLEKIMMPVSALPEVEDVTSLVESSVRTIVIVMWNHFVDLKDLGSCIEFDDELIMTISFDIMEEALKLLLPIPLIDKIIDFVQSIGMQILGWRTLHNQFAILNGYRSYRWFHPLNAEVPYIYAPEVLVWTPHGVIDKAKTAKKIIESNYLNLAHCFKLACLYCLEDYILNLWKYVDEAEKMELVNSEYFLLCFWSRILSKTFDEHYAYFFSHVVCDEIIIEDAFRISAVCHNIAATKYFLQRLDLKNKRNLIINVAVEVLCRKSNEYKFHQLKGVAFPEEYFGGEVFCYLLELLDKEEQKEVICRNSCMALMNIISWPSYQRRFSEVAELAYPLLKEREYLDLLHFILSRHDICKFSFQQFLLNCPKILPEKLHLNELECKNLKMLFKNKFALKINETEDGEKWIVSADALSLVSNCNKL